MTPVERRIHIDKKGVNFVQALCFTCWDAGKVLFQKHMGYGDTLPVPKHDLNEAMRIAHKHDKTHRIVVHVYKRE